WPGRHGSAPPGRAAAGGRRGRAGAPPPGSGNISWPAPAPRGGPENRSRRTRSPGYRRDFVRSWGGSRGWWRRQRAQYPIGARVYRGCGQQGAVDCLQAALTVCIGSPYLCAACPGGGIGRRAGFRYQWLIAVEVRVLSWAPASFMVLISLALSRSLALLG